MLSSTQQYSDRARRGSEAVTLAMLGTGREAVGKWMALKLSDGGSDNKLYDTKGDARRHQLHPQQCAYVMIPPDGMSPRQAENYLRFVESLYDAGADISDPERQVQMPSTMPTARGLIRAIARGR